MTSRGRTEAVGDEAGIRVDPRLLPKDPDGMRAAWSIIENGWSATVDRARRLPEPVARERVEGEWSLVETLRHLIFVTDSWVRRTVLGEAHAYHLLGLPPDGDVDVAPWGIDVAVEPSLDEVMIPRLDRMAAVRQVVDELAPAALSRTCAPNPAPGFPPMTALQVGFCLNIVIGEEWAHREFAVRDLAVLEGRA